MLISLLVFVQTEPPPTPVPAGPFPPELRRKSTALKSVVKVFSTKVDPNYAQPWQMLPQRSSTASAFVIDTDKRYLLTNAHAVGQKA